MGSQQPAEKNYPEAKKNTPDDVIMMSPELCQTGWSGSLMGWSNF